MFVPLDMTCVASLPSTVLTRGISQQANLAKIKTKKWVASSSLSTLMSRMNLASPPPGGSNTTDTELQLTKDDLNAIDFSLHPKGNKLLVSNVFKNSTAATLGVAKGDIVKRIHGCNDTRPNGILTYMKIASGPFKIVFRRKGCSPAAPAANGKST